MTRRFEDILVSEAGLSSIQARVYLLITTDGRMDIVQISEKLGISQDEAHQAAAQLVALGGIIEYTDILYEALHPRFAAVNMYRRYCERRGVDFGRNKDIDNLGAALEQPYDTARTN